MSTSITQAAGPGENWEFDGDAPLRGWQIIRAKATAEKGILSIEGYFPQLRIPMPPETGGPDSFAHLSIKSTKDRVIELTLFTGAGLAGEKNYTKFLVTGDSRYHDYRFSLKRITPGINTLSAMAINIPGSVSDLEIDFIRIYQPGFTETLSIAWHEFWRPDPIAVTTINFTDTPAIGTTGLFAISYVFIGVIALFLILRRKKQGLPVTKAAVTAAISTPFLAAGLLVTIRMDYNWLSEFKRDLRGQSGTTVEERIQNYYPTHYADFHTFLMGIKAELPEGATIAPAVMSRESRYATFARYHLLPHLETKEARFHWVYYDHEVQYNTTARTLSTLDNATVLRDVELVKAFPPMGSLYKKVNGGGL